MPPSEQNFADITITEEKIGFDPSELIACSKCGRSNAPNRLKCMYCATELDVPQSAKENVHLDAKRPEPWENGVNIICVRATENVPELSEIADSIGIDKEFLAEAIHAELPIPLARVGSETEATLIAERLAANGIETSIADDKALDSYRPRRVRSVEMDEHELAFVLFNSDEVVRLEKYEIVLVVVGKIFENEIQSTELRKFRKTEPEDQVMTKARSSVIDIYANDTAFRIHERGFDYSSLGEQKSFIAADNIVKLLEMIRGFATAARIDERYEWSREMLGAIWELDETQDAGGVSRTGMGKLIVTRSTRQHNTTQFNKFSAMLWHTR